jgi:hypothetical protein
MELSMSDLTVILFLLICVWLIVEMGDGGGGGHRIRVPLR